MQPIDNKRLEPIRTEDGTSTVRRLDLDVTYRSQDGAIGESEHVFIQASGLTQHLGPWRVLELGFGLGTNLVRLIHAARHAKVALEYVGIEPEPIPADSVPEESGDKAIVQELLEEARSTERVAKYEREGLNIALIPRKWQDASLSPFDALAIFHDPFDPRTNPDCWGADVFEWEKSHLASNGIITTYGAAGHVRRSMRDAGLFVAQAPGYGRKREMTLASPREDVLAPHKVKYRP